MACIVLAFTASRHTPHSSRRYIDTYPDLTLRAQDLSEVRSY